jgi:hypothetical protein
VPIWVTFSALDFLLKEIPVAARRDATFGYELWLSKTEEEVYLFILAGLVICILEQTLLADFLRLLVSLGSTLHLVFKLLTF